MTEKDLTTHQILKNLSTQDFLNFGIQQIAYIRPLDVEDKTAYGIFAADGTPLSVMDTMDTAAIVIQHNDLEIATVH